MPVQSELACSHREHGRLCRCLQYALQNGAHITLNSYGAMNANSASLSSAVFATQNAGQLFVTAAGLLHRPPPQSPRLPLPLFPNPNGQAWLQTPRIISIIQPCRHYVLLVLMVPPLPSLPPPPPGGRPPSLKQSAISHAVSHQATGDHEVMPQAHFGVFQGSRRSCPREISVLILPAASCN